MVNPVDSRGEFSGSGVDRKTSDSATSLLPNSKSGVLAQLTKAKEYMIKNPKALLASLAVGVFTAIGFSVGLAFAIHSGSLAAIVGCSIGLGASVLGTGFSCYCIVTIASRAEE